MASTLYLLCGLPGSGKTTRARELEAAGEGIVLNADDWVCQLYPDDAEAAARDERKGLVEQVQWELAERLLGSGINVILDWGVWMQAERDHIDNVLVRWALTCRRFSSMRRLRYFTSVWLDVTSIARPAPSASLLRNSTSGSGCLRHRRRGTDLAPETSGGAHLPR